MKSLVLRKLRKKKHKYGMCKLEMVIEIEIKRIKLH